MCTSLIYEVTVQRVSRKADIVQKHMGADLVGVFRMTVVAPPALLITPLSGAPENLRKNEEWRTSSPLQSSLINLCYQTCSMKYDRKRYGVCMEYARHRYDICTKYGWNVYHHHTMQFIVKDSELVVNDTLRSTDEAKDLRNAFS